MERIRLVFFVAHLDFEKKTPKNQLGSQSRLFGDSKEPYYKVGPYDRYEWSFGPLQV